MSVSAPIVYGIIAGILGIVGIFLLKQVRDTTTAVIGEPGKPSLNLLVFAGLAAYSIFKR